LQGEAREVGRVAAALAIDSRPAQCLILGGETTVTVKGDGIGGRNQELALSAAIALDQQRAVAVAGFATDGEDGTTDAAGAVVTGETASISRRMGLDPHPFLRRNDSHTFFSRLAQRGLDCLLRTGATGTNVNDLLIVLKYPSET
jgi:hydroxypyruvate reductase